MYLFPNLFPLTSPVFQSIRNYHRKKRSLLLQESERWPPLLEPSPLLPYNLPALYNLSWALCSVPFDPSFAYLCNLEF